MNKWTCSICGATHGYNLAIPAWKQMMRMVCKGCHCITEHIRNGLIREANNDEG